MKSLVPVSVSLVVALLLSCGAATPVYFSKGTRWTLPLVGPLENDRLVVAATVHERGPFLFVLDPDATASMIDRGLAEALGLYTRPHAWSSFVDHRDREVRRRAYEVLRFSSGDLQIRNKVMFGAPAGSLAYRGQRIHGLLGRDLLTRTISIDVDRDRGVVHLALTGHETPHRSAVAVQGRVHKRRSSPPRKIVLAVGVAGEHNKRVTADLAVDLAARTTAVWPNVLRSAGVTMAPATEAVVDGMGSAQTIHGRGQALLGIGGSQTVAAGVIPFADKRVRDRDYAGVLGQNVLSRYRLTFNADKRRLLLSKREADLGVGIRARVKRWANTFGRCLDTGCALVTVRRDHEGLTHMMVARRAGAPRGAFEVVLEPLDASGVALGLPLVRVTLRRGSNASPGPTVLARLRAASQFRVVDASPFAPPCAAGACFALLGARSPDALGKPGPTSAGLIITDRHIYRAAATH